MRRGPPSTRDYNVVRNDAGATDEVLADDVDIVEMSVLNQQNGRISRAAGLETARLWAPRPVRGIDGRRGNDVKNWYTEAQASVYGKFTGT